MHANDYQALAGRTLLDTPDFQITDEQDEVMWHNVEKLRARFPEGYEAARTTAAHKVGIAE